MENKKFLDPDADPDSGTLDTDPHRSSRLVLGLRSTSPQNFIERRRPRPDPHHKM